MRCLRYTFKIKGLKCLGRSNAIIIVIRYEFRVVIYRLFLKGLTVPFLFGSDFKEYTTDTTVKFIVSMPEEKLIEAEEKGLHTVFKLQSSFSNTSMVLFDHMGVLRK